MARNADRPLRRLTETFINLYPAEAAGELDKAPADEVTQLLESLPPRRAILLWEKLALELAAECLQRMGEGAAGNLLAAAQPPHAASVVARLDDESRDRLMAVLPAALAADLRDLLTYPEGTAGHIMDPNVASFSQDMPVRELLRRLHALRRQRAQTIFVVDAEGRLVGALSLQDAILAESTQRLSELVTGPPVFVRATAPREEVVEQLADYRLGSLPVLDFDGHLVGTIRRESMIQAVQEEAMAGMQAMVGASREERALSPPLFVVRKRLGWLNINLLTAFLAASVVGIFESTIAQFTALAVLLPVVAGQSGNTGAQALAVTMRGLSLREVRVKHWPRIMLKETVAGAINGLAIALVTMIGVYIWDGRPGLCLIIGVAMVVAMAIAAAAGTGIPMILTALRQDPAQSSSIILTTVTDVVGFFSFLGLATLLAGMLRE